MLPSAVIVEGGDLHRWCQGRCPAPRGVWLGLLQEVVVRCLEAAWSGASQHDPEHAEHRAGKVLLLTLLSHIGDPDPVLRCIVSGFFANAARFHSTGAYR